MSQKQSEFFLALTQQRHFNVTTVCEIGATSGHSAITWLESAPWVNVFSFARALGTADAAEKQGGEPSGDDPHAPDEDDDFARLKTSAPVFAAPAAASAAASEEIVQGLYGSRFTKLELQAAGDASPDEIERDVTMLAAMNQMPS